MSLVSGVGAPAGATGYAGPANLSTARQAANPRSAPETQGPTQAKSPDPPAAGNPSFGLAESEILQYVNGTAAQQIRAAALKSMGLTEQDLERMTPEQRMAVEDSIDKEIKDAVEQGKTGLVTDVTA